MANNKITKDSLPTDFTMGLALVDAIPVVFFGINSILISVLLDNYFMMAGAIICLISGAIKVLWKMIVVLNKRNIWWMFLQMRIFMPIGFLLMIIALSVFGSWLPFFKGMLIFPSVIFFSIGVLSMVLMTVFCFILDSTDKKSNWIEQLTNGIGQIFIFIGVLILFLL